MTELCARGCIRRRHGQKEELQWVQQSQTVDLFVGFYRCGVLTHNDQLALRLNVEGDSLSQHKGERNLANVHFSFSARFYHEVKYSDKVGVNPRSLFHGQIFFLSVRVFARVFKWSAGA